MAERRRATASVRFRVTALATIVAAATLAVTGAILVRYQRQMMIETLDESLVTQADQLAARLPGAGATFPGIVDDDGFAQLTDGDRVIAATPNLRDHPAVASAPATGQRVTTVHDVIEDEPAFRVLSRHVAGDRQLTLNVGASMEDINEVTGRLAMSLAVALPVVLALLAGLVWTLVGRTLAPVESIRAEVAALGATDLHRRVPEPARDDEIGRLARTMNAMLDRLEDSARRQRRFVADASHELRSPLTRIRTDVEVDLAHPAEADLEATHRRILDETADLERLINDLLALARADDGLEPAVRETVDLDELVLRHTRRIRELGQVEIDTTGVSGAQVHGDPRQLGRAIGNLLDNAARHASRTVTVTLAEEGGSAVLAVADDGPGIPADEHERIFERFARVDDARTRESGGTGLGLAITRDIVERHNGTVAVDPGRTSGARLVVQLPLD
jgi:signal transduction histidine kinase